MMTWQDMLRASNRLELVDFEIEAKTREMSKTPSAKRAEVNAELEALQQARDQLRVECSELQSKTDSDLSDDESRRYATLTSLFCVVLTSVSSKNLFVKQHSFVDFVYVIIRPHQMHKMQTIAFDIPQCGHLSICLSRGHCSYSFAR